MIELTQQMGVGIAYESCRRFVGPLIGLAFAAAGAQAGAWEEFQTRCLSPVEELEAPVIAGLVPTEPNDGFLVWEGRGGWLLSIQGSLDAPQSCMISGFEWGDATVKSVADWSQAAVDDARYEPLPKLALQSPQVLRSTDWREPKVEVSVQRFHPELGPYLLIVETDLES